MALTMRTHAEIIRDAGGWREVRNALALPTDDARCKFWFFRDSIPCEYWKALADLEFTSVEELALAAHRKRYLREAANAPSINRKPGRPRKEVAA
jgi:hypothetical protein